MRLRAAAGVLAALPGGPGLAEARTRLARGQPLVVGLTRDDAEKLQDRLVEHGLVPRIGPAPEGTQPLVRARSSEPWPALLVAAALAAAAVGAVLVRSPARPGELRPSDPARDVATPPPRSGASDRQAAAGRPAAAEPRLELWAEFRVSASGLQLAGLVRGHGEQPQGTLTLVGRAAGHEVLNRTLAGSFARLPFRLPMQRAQLLGADELVLEASWGEHRSPLVVVKVPGG